MARFPGHPDHDPAAPMQAGSTRTRRRWVPRVALLAAVALGVVALLVGVGTLTGPAPEPGAGASGGPSPADPPAPDTESPAASGPARTDSALYRVSWEAGAVDCPDTPRPAPPLPNPELADHLREIVDCLVGTHRPMLESVGLTLTVPAVATFSTDVHTPCGVVAARDFPAFYCSGNETIYVRLDSDEDPNGYARSAMGYWIVMSHEFGHHLQQRAGIFDEYIELRARASGPELAELSRRLELQANCFSGAFLGGSGDNLGFPAHHRETLDFYRYISGRDSGAASHGNRQSAAAWFDAGYRSRSFEQCVTWEAPANRVA